MYAQLAFRYEGTHPVALFPQPHMVVIPLPATHAGRTSNLILSAALMLAGPQFSVAEESTSAGVTTMPLRLAKGETIEVTVDPSRTLHPTNRRCGGIAMTGLARWCGKAGQGTSCCRCPDFRLWMRSRNRLLRAGD